MHSMWHKSTKIRSYAGRKPLLNSIIHSLQNLSVFYLHVGWQRYEKLLQQDVNFFMKPGSPQGLLGERTYVNLLMPGIGIQKGLSYIRSSCLSASLRFFGSPGKIIIQQRCRVGQFCGQAIFELMESCAGSAWKVRVRSFSCRILYRLLQYICPKNISWPG